MTLHRYDITAAQWLPPREPAFIAKASDGLAVWVKHQPMVYLPLFICKCEVPDASCLAYDAKIDVSRELCLEYLWVPRNEWAVFRCADGDALADHASRKHHADAYPYDWQPDLLKGFEDASHLRGTRFLCPGPTAPASAG